MPTRIYEHSKVSNNLEGISMTGKEIEVVPSDPESEAEDEVEVNDDGDDEDYDSQSESDPGEDAECDATKDCIALTQEQQEENKKKFKDSHRTQSGVSTRVSVLKIVNKKTANSKRRTPKAPTEKQIDQVKDHVTNFMDDDIRSMVVRTFLLSTPPPKSFWLRNVVPFLVTNEGMGYNPKMWCMPNPSMIAKSFPDVIDRIKQRDYKAPKIGNFTTLHKAALDTAYQFMVTDWEKWHHSIRNDYRKAWLKRECHEKCEEARRNFGNQVNGTLMAAEEIKKIKEEYVRKVDNIPLDKEGQPLDDLASKLIPVPPPPTYQAVDKMFKKCRLVFWQLLTTQKHASDRDVWLDVLEWCAKNLVTIEGEKEFMEKVDKRVEENIQALFADKGIDARAERDKITAIKKRKREAIATAKEARKRPSSAMPPSALKASAEKDMACVKAKDSNNVQEEAEKGEKEGKPTLETKETHKVPTEKHSRSKRAIGIKTVLTQPEMPAKVTQSPCDSGKSKQFFGKDDLEDQKGNSKNKKRTEKPQDKPEWYSKAGKDKTEELIERLKVNDPILHDLLLTYGREVCGKKGASMFRAALLGIYCKHPVDVLNHYMGIDPKSVVPPMQKKRNSHDFTSPSNDFKDVAMECLRVMEIFLKSCEYGGVSPDRWLWDFILCSLMDDLEEEDLYQRSPDRDAFAKLVCLVLSGNTKDETCIRMTCELAKHGLLDVNAMADADLKTIQDIIRSGGYWSKRAVFLKEMSQGIRDKHGGRVPESLLALMAFDGIARKTAVLALNELLGKFEGIGTDIHVIETVKALLFILMQNRDQNVNATHAEASLRTWVPKHMYPVINKLFGSFSQLFTQNIPARANVFDNPEYLSRISKAAGMFLREDYHISLLFCMIHATRRRYRS